MKFCRPIFRLIDKVDPELAKKTFKQHASFYVSTSLSAGCDKHSMRYWVGLMKQHPIARRMIARDLGVDVE
jgi:leukotriene-A4 hydrolase